MVRRVARDVSFLLKVRGSGGEGGRIFFESALADDGKRSDALDVSLLAERPSLDSPGLSCEAFGVLRLTV